MRTCFFSKEIIDFFYLIMVKAIFSLAEDYDLHGT